jgi:5-methylcytosine-specific restriction enzyme subunit McrC
MAALARRVPLLQAALPCVDHERITDHLLNRVLLAGLALAARVAVHPPLRGQLRELAARLGDEIQGVPLTRPLLAAARRSLHRLVSHYRPALEIVALLHAGCGLDLTDAPRESTAAGFLFDMNRFFQALMVKLLTEELLDCAVQAEQKLAGAYRWARPALPGRRQPRPRPDITVVRGDERLLLDAKYRDLSVGPLPREILYQLTVYAASQGPGGSAAILYPKHEAPALPEERLDLFAPGGSAAHAVVFLRPVPLVELAGSVAAGDAGAAFRRALARTLAFGAT